MAILMKQNHFKRIILISLFFLFCGTTPVFSQEVLATFGYGAYVPIDAEEDYLALLYGVNVLFRGKSGLTVSTGTEVRFYYNDYYEQAMSYTYISAGLGYVYYNKFYLGIIGNIGSFGVFAPTLVGGYDFFGRFLLGGQLSYELGLTENSSNGFKLSIGVGVNIGGGSSGNSAGLPSENTGDTDDWW